MYSTAVFRPLKLKSRLPDSIIERDLFVHLKNSICLAVIREGDLHLIAWIEMLGAQLSDRGDARRDAREALLGLPIALPSISTIILAFE